MYTTGHGHIFHSVEFISGKYTETVISYLHMKCRVSSSYFFYLFRLSYFLLFFRKSPIFSNLWGFVQSGHVYFLYKVEIVCYFGMFTFQIQVGPT